MNLNLKISIFEYNKCFLLLVYKWFIYLRWLYTYICMRLVSGLTVNFSATRFAQFGAFSNSWNFVVKKHRTDDALLSGACGMIFR